MNQGPHVLVILDGFGYRHAHEHNAVYAAHPEHFYDGKQNIPQRPRGLWYSCRIPAGYDRQFGGRPFNYRQWPYY